MKRFLLGMVCLSACAASSVQAATLTRFASGFEQPTTLTHAGDGSGRLFVVEQTGRIRVLEGGKTLPTPFADLSSLTAAGGERGLLGLAFDPRFKTNGRFFVNYTDTQGDTVIARYTVSSGNRNVADPRSARIILRIDQPYANHNGGNLAFGPDGMLYIGMGDGGSGGDPQNYGQNMNSLLGKMLRLDVSGDGSSVPRDNPFVGKAGIRPEIWASGLRNPWKFSFDARTGDLWTADVGQNRLEEVNFQPAASKGGENYGWRLKEGGNCFNPQRGCERGSLTDPVFQYPRSEGVSVTGGYVYRGSSVPDLSGRYIFGDFATGKIWATARGSDGKFSTKVLMDTDHTISAFGQDEKNELYLVAYDGTLYKFGK